MDYYILHIDDQPEFISWLPGTLNRHFKRSIDRRAEYEEEQIGSERFRAQFDLNPGTEAEQIKVHYELLYQEGPFQQRFLEIAPNEKIITIFDFHIGSDTSDGVELVSRLFGQQQNGSHGRWIFLTGFANEANARLEAKGLYDGSVIAKPPNTTTFVGLIAQAVVDRLSQSQD